MRKRDSKPTQGLGRSITQSAQFLSVVQQALKGLHPGPWALMDLVRINDLISEELCFRIGPDCAPAAVLAWLRGLGLPGQEQLLHAINMRWAQARSAA